MRENIIKYQDEGGGEEDLNAVDLLPLKVPGQETDPDTKIKLKGEKLTLNTRLLFFFVNDSSLLRNARKIIDPDCKC